MGFVRFDSIFRDFIFNSFTDRACPKLYIMSEKEGASLEIFSPCLKLAPVSSEQCLRRVGHTKPVRDRGPKSRGGLENYFSIWLAMWQLIGHVTTDDLRLSSASFQFEGQLGSLINRFSSLIVYKFFSPLKWACKVLCLERRGYVTTACLTFQYGWGSHLPTIAHLSIEFTRFKSSLTHDPGWNNKNLPI